MISTEVYSCFALHVLCLTITKVRIAWRVSVTRSSLTAFREVQDAQRGRSSYVNTCQVYKPSLESFLIGFVSQVIPFWMSLAVELTPSRLPAAISSKVEKVRE
jgi:hypothetical protein